MRSLYAVATAAFLLFVAGLWTVHELSSREAALDAPSRYTLDQVAAHAGAEDCWMVIEGSVYDLTSYLPEHPTRMSVIAEWCGREATIAFATKNRGRPHSAYAHALLNRYEIGALEGAERK